ncbi:type VI secretion protein [Streptomyces sp. A1499]|uniref:type VI secretion protein n=1 Tax=Streptomyces sp. A1499 TaxID=2563104 RepID=UPI00109E7E1F|nr:type VI secretion protein [Streptomyces sp. A1499]THC44011.1 type VI secretion protein [Streptomyces sp. A1499]
MRDEWERGRSGGYGHGGPGRGARSERGVPDALLLGILGFLLGATVLAWSSTGLGGRFAHGAWPENVTFGHTPLAVRHLIGHPQDLAGAWPETPAEQLSGYGLFWGLFIGQLMVLLVLTVFVVGTFTRWRAVRRARRLDAAARRAAVAGTAVGAGASAGAGSVSVSGADAASGAGASAAAAAPAAGPAQAPAGPTRAPVAPPQAPLPAPAAEAPVAFPVAPATGTPAAPPPVTAPVEAVPAAETAPLAAAAAAVPLPRSPLVLGGPDARRPHALQAVRDAEGAALVLTSDPTLWEETKDARAKLGPVLLYDPSHLCDTPARMHWSPTSGCEDKATAAQRAAALLAPIRPAARLDAAMADTAELLLRSFLHAAAVGDKPMKNVHRWSQGTQVQEAVRILRTHPRAASGAAGELEAALTAYPERRDVAQELTARALSALFTVHVRESCTPNRTDALTLDSFVHEGGTLFVVGEAIEDPKSRQGPGAMPLLTALASSVVEHGRRMAERSSSGRLDPPMTLVLDDAAAVAPLPQLPELLLTGADQGLPALALLRSREQGRSRWPDSELPLV